MNEINFLPESYRRRQLHRRARARRWTLLSALATCAALGWVMQEQQTASLSAEAAEIAKQVQAVHDSQLEVNRLSRRRDALAAQVKLQRRMGMALHDSQVINALGSHLPTNVGLTDLSMHKASGGAHSHGKKTSGAVGAMQVEIQGMAPDDVVVANLVSSLSQDALFSDVTMKFSRPVSDGSVSGRAFGLTMQVNLNRRFIVAQGGSRGQHED